MTNGTAEFMQFYVQFESEITLTCLLAAMLASTVLQNATDEPRLTAYIMQVMRNGSVFTGTVRVKYSMRFARKKLTKNPTPPFVQLVSDFSMGTSSVMMSEVMARVPV